MKNLENQIPNPEQISTQEEPTSPLMERPVIVQASNTTAEDLQKIEQIREKLGLLNSQELPLTTMGQFVLDKKQKGETLSVGEGIHAGRDKVYTGGSIPGIEIKPDYVYRAIDEATLRKYIQYDSVEGHLEAPDIYAHEKDNNGVDWYLGGVCLRYGSFVLETKAKADSFEIADKDHHMMAQDPYVRHVKSEGGTEKSIHMDDVKVYKISKGEEGARQAVEIDKNNF